MATPEEILRRKIRSIYHEAGLDIQQKLKDFEEAHKRKSAQMLADVAAGKLSPQDYQKWMRGQVFTGQRWKEKLDDVTQTYVDADKKAREIISGTTRNVFVNFANRTAFDLEKGMNGAVSFDLYDARTVERLLRRDPKMLPEWKIDEPKDYMWNEKRVRRSVTQGIIQGESVDDVCGRLTGELATSNEKKMTMFARTAINGAQNAGRMERLHEAQDMGIEVKKKWLATLDERTRDTHQALDGQEQPIDEPFEVDGMKIDYPGDPLAPPELVYNCRCTLTYVYPKFRHLEHGERRDQKNNKNIEDMTYYEWVGLKKREEKQRETLPDDGVMVGVKKTKQTGYKETAQATNPNYAKGKEYRDNCSCCVVANEMRARGYDVTAGIADANMRWFWYDTQKNVGKGSWTDCFEGITNVDIKARLKSQQVKKITEIMEGYGSGSRAVVFVEWDRGGGHYFTVQNVDGVVKFTNPQKPDANAESFFHFCKPSKTRIFRVDNLKATEYVRKVVVANEE